MENHPIPQDVTGFQFKLIGDMTVKQFAYLAGGTIIGWFFFSLPIPLFIKIPITAFFILLGISLAFLPLAGRPMDTMLANFIKALFSPTQFIYQKTNTNLLFPKLTYNLKLKPKKEPPKTAGKEVQRVFLQALPKMPKNKLDEKEMNFFKSLFGSTVPPRIISVNLKDQPKTNMPADAPQPFSQKNTTEMLQRKAFLIEKELENAKKEETLQEMPLPTNQSVQHQKVLELEGQLQEVLREKERLTEQLMMLQQKLGAQKEEIYTPTTASVKKETKNVRRIPSALGKTLGLPIAPDVPNLIAGIIKNPRGQLLPNILVEIKDAEGNAVRAFKTNGIGQFASATPLANGVYTLTFEDPTKRNKFDTIEFTASDEIILPIEVISVDTREELRRSLFNNNS